MSQRIELKRQSSHGAPFAQRRGGQTVVVADSSHLFAERSAWLQLRDNRLPPLLDQCQKKIFAIFEVAVDGSSRHAHPLCDRIQSGGMKALLTNNGRGSL